MRQIARSVFAGAILGVLVAGSSSVMAAPPPSGTFIPVVINVYKDAGYTDAQIDDMIKEANKILKQADFKLVPVKVNKDFKEGDRGEDGKVDWTTEEYNQWVDAGKKEIDKLPNKKGIKISLAKEVEKDAPNTYGWAFHNQCTACVQNRGNTADNGATLAHEVGHIFLPDNHVISSGPPAVNANGGHAANTPGDSGRGNLMASAGFRTGTKLTPEQIAKMKERRFTFGKCSTQFEQAFPAKKEELQFGAKVDDPGDSAFVAAPASSDILNTFFQSRNGDSAITGEMTLAGPFSGTVNQNYAFALNIDGLPSGGPYNGFNGVDYAYEVNVTGSAGTYVTTAQLRNIATSVVIPAPAPQIIDSTLVDEPNDTVVATDAQLRFDLPKSMVGLPDTYAGGNSLVNVGAISFFSSLVNDSESFDFDLLKAAGDPTLLTSGDGVPTPGQPYPFSLSGLQPNDPFTVYLNDDAVYSGTLDPTGAASGSFIFPTGLDLSTPQFLTGQDSTGEFGYSITCPDASLVPEPMSTLPLLLAGMLMAGRRGTRR